MSQPNSATTQAKIEKTRAPRKLSNEAIRKLELEYFKKRRELEREHKIQARAGKAEKLALAKKSVAELRKRFAMTDDQIVKRLGLKPATR